MTLGADVHWLDELLPNTGREWAFAFLMSVMLFGGGAAFYLGLSRSTQDEPFAPLQPIQPIRVAPETIDRDGSIVLFDGYCLKSDRELSISVYVGLQRVESQTLAALESVPVVGTDDSEEGRRKGVMQPGCTGQTQSTPFPVGRLLTAGTWQVIVHVLVRGPSGEVQDLILTSNQIEVVAE